MVEVTGSNPVRPTSVGGSLGCRIKMVPDFLKSGGTYGDELGFDFMRGRHRSAADDRLRSQAITGEDNDVVNVPKSLFADAPIVALPIAA